MASKSKIYFAMEFVRGGELFSKVARGRLREEAARQYFQQLIGAVDFCHSRGVYHRDLKPENLLLDEKGDLKVTDFGLSALADTQRHDGLLHTTCGTPAYVAPEVINKRGYDGAKADVWSCGVILFVLLAGFLPFHDSNLMEMYRKISRGEFRCPNWFLPDVRRLLSRLLDPNPSTRITIAKLVEHPWFRKGFKPVQAQMQDGRVPDDVDAAFSTGTAAQDEEEDKKKNKKVIVRPASFNAFDIISLSKGFDLSGLFDGCGRQLPAEARFTTQKPAATIVSRLEEIAETSGSFRVKRKEDGTVKLQGRKEGRKGQLSIDAEIFEVTPSFHVVEVKKSAGDTLEYQEFCDRGLKPSLQDIVWTWQEIPMSGELPRSTDSPVSAI
ncbi:hypothetical protein HPP92_003611 [Vanilla planifolia]|uniref:non-specific serine/threonine protein kinase n=1 Tax=Vanilla planifolia TaxID=51239 RepID=A0A835RW44_VANPL|nr:hypothetical protein HPP92_004000 [Vanilla planifolia]KAG0503539.1 hypothetical protein HPP92_003611 [Vanilla planifolia]